MFKDADMKILGNCLSWINLGGSLKLSDVFANSFDMLWYIYIYIYIYVYVYYSFNVYIQWLFIWDLHNFTQNPNVHTCTLVIRLSGILLGHFGVSMTKEYPIPKTMGFLWTSSNSPSIFQQLQIHLFPTIYLWNIIKHKYQLSFM